MDTQEQKTESTVTPSTSSSDKDVIPIKKTKTARLSYLSAHLTAHLNWMYCELTGQESAPALLPSLRVCRLDSMFDVFFRHVDCSYFEASSIYRCTAALLERIFTVKVRYTKIEEEMKKIGFKFMYFKLKDAHRLITQEYRKCECYKKSNKHKDALGLSKD